MTTSDHDLLQCIVARRRERFGVSATSGPPHPLTGAFASSSSSTSSKDNPFLAALGAARGRAVIAEVKMGSPRLGALAAKVDPLAQVAAYREAGAVCLSVVVEPDFFFGSYELLEACREEAGLPALAKDFVVSERQLDEAAEAGADAVLLVAALYDARELAGWAAAARARGLAPLVETRDEVDVAKLAGGGWELVGINNRDLRDFSVDLERSLALRPRLPAGALAVAESGIATRGDVEKLAAGGFDAFLVGEALLLAADPRAKLAELVG